MSLVQLAYYCTIVKLCTSNAPTKTQKKKTRPLSQSAIHRQKNQLANYHAMHLRRVKKIQLTNCIWADFCQEFGEYSTLNEEGRKVEKVNKCFMVSLESFGPKTGETNSWCSESQRTPQVRRAVTVIDMYCARLLHAAMCSFPRGCMVLQLHR